MHTREREREADGQTDRQTDRQADGIQPSFRKAAWLHLTFRGSCVVRSSTVSNLTPVKRRVGNTTERSSVTVMPTSQALAPALGFCQSTGGRDDVDILLIELETRQPSASRPSEKLIIKSMSNRR